MTSIQSRTCRKGICWSLARILECICGLAFREHISRVAIQCCTACSLLEACCVRNVPRPVFRDSCRVPCSACISMFCHLCSVGSGRVLPASCRSMPAVCVLLLQDLSGPSRKQVMPKTRLRATSTTCVTPSPPGSRLTKKRTCGQPFPRSSTVSRCVQHSPALLACRSLNAATVHTTAASVLWCTCAQSHAEGCCVRWRLDARGFASFVRLVLEKLRRLAPSPPCGLNASSTPRLPGMVVCRWRKCEQGYIRGEVEGPTGLTFVLVCICVCVCKWREQTHVCVVV